MFLNAEPFFGIISSYRILWIGGRVGGHKTSLAYAIAERYLKEGYRLITNNMSVWADDLEKCTLDENGHLRAVVLLDEGGLYFKSSKQIELIASYPAKMDVIYIIPSFWPPAQRAQILTCQPLFNLKAAGLPVVVYRWRVKIGAFEDKGLFAWLFPSSVYGIYSRQDPGDTAEKIISFLVNRTSEYRAMYGRNNSVSELVTVTEIDQFQDAVQSLAEAVESYASIPVRKGRRR